MHTPAENIVGSKRAAAGFAEEPGQRAGRHAAEVRRDSGWVFLPRRNQSQLLGYR